MFCTSIPGYHFPSLSQSVERIFESFHEMMIKPTVGLVMLYVRQSWYRGDVLMLCRPVYPVCNVVMAVGGSMGS